jgi:SAM-dependent methyltransferase
MNREAITERMRIHHAEVFATHGATPRGVDWSDNQADIDLRYDNMLAVTRGYLPLGRKPRLLDVGCGYGGLLDRIIERGAGFEYAGIDICEDMIVEARRRHPDADFSLSDLFAPREPGESDFLVCNGILTQKLDAGVADMDAFVRSVVSRMFDLCGMGAAFNLMSNRVNFMADNLFYKSPVEMLSWCLSELTPHVRLDHAYPLYEFTVYLYKDGVPR